MDTVVSRVGKTTFLHLANSDIARSYQISVQPTALHQVVTTTAKLDIAAPVPAGAIRDRDGNPILDRDGNYIVKR